MEDVQRVRIAYFGPGATCTNFQYIPEVRGLGAGERVRML